MSALQLNALDVNPTGLKPSDILGVDGSAQPAAYGLTSASHTTGASPDVAIDFATQPLATSLDTTDLATPHGIAGGITPSPRLTQDGTASGEPGAGSHGDALTGLAAEDPLLFNLSGTTQSPQNTFGRLDYSDYFNPTRLYAYKDDHLLTSTASGTVQVNLNSVDFDAYLQLVNVFTGQVLAFDDDGGPGTNAQLSFTALAGGQYLIRVTSYESFEVGGYSLTATLGAGGNQPTPQPPPERRFDSASGYGLVDAAAAVATAVGQSRFSNVADLGGNQWNNDLVNAPEVWRQGYTGQGVTVAVIDSGVDITHADLRDNIWVNSDEVLGDGIDNDGNGYVDDRYGWNFGRGQNNNNVLPGTTDPGQSHGTHVAGTIAAANNGTGMTGVAHNANIMAIRLGNVVTGPRGGAFVNGGDLAQAIRYAVDNGAQVINMSLGWSDPDGSVQAALAYAAERNVLTVSAAGNDSLSAPGSPASYATEYGISVGAVDRSEQISDFSNRAGSDSRLVHVMAPGRGIYSTIPNNTYNFDSGTSMAAPHVAGVVALMLSANPDLTHSQVRAILTGTSTLQATLNGSSVEESANVFAASRSTVQAGSSLGYFPVARLSRPIGELGETGDELASLGLPSLSIATLTTAALERRPATSTASTDDDWLTPLPELLGDDWLAESWG
ncbi:MAG: S8 family peptidase [Nodosilinea sp.]